jgi:hypothetical protein
MSRSISRFRRAGQQVIAFQWDHARTAWNYARVQVLTKEALLSIRALISEHRNS